MRIVGAGCRDDCRHRCDWRSTSAGGAESRVHILNLEPDKSPTSAPCMPPGYSSSPSTLSNPAHILIGRNNRTVSSSPHAASSASPHHHHSSPADPLQSIIAASGTFPRQSASPPWLFEEMNEDEHDNTNSGREDGGEATPIDVDSTFTKEGRWPGTVKIVVEATTFWYAFTSAPGLGGDLLSSC